MKIYLSALSLAIAVSSPLPLHAGNVKCTCPAIAADGVGNSSCSASEADDRCTVDFNEFGEALEQEAVATIESLADGLGLEVQPPSQLFQSTPEFSLEIAKELEPDALVVQIMSYAFVALLQTESGFWIKEDSEFGEALSDLLNQSDAVAQAFLTPGIQIGDPDELYFVSHGCLEIETSSDNWVMYKAFWSNAARSPQCVP